jgi:hypothetical protein
MPAQSGEFVDHGLQVRALVRYVASLLAILAALRGKTAVAHTWVSIS